MSQIVLSNNTQPPNPFQDAPRTMVYDPGKQIHNPVEQLAPFGRIVKFCHEVKELTKNIENARNRQLILLLIFPNNNDVQVRDFLSNYIPNQAHLHSLYLIFRDGLQFHEKWIDTESMPKLRWCRSFTLRLIRDICDVCESACNENIEFYQQQIIIAQDAVDRDTINNAESIVAVYAEEKRKFSLLVKTYLST